MNKWLTLPLLFLLAGCAPTPVVAPDLSSVAGKIGTAVDRIHSAQKVLAPSESQAAPYLNDAVRLLAGERDSAMSELAKKQQEVEGVTGKLNLAAAETGVQTRLAWKWRLISLGSWAGFIALIAFRTYLKTIPGVGWLINLILP